jgi:hypothetical protein
MSVLSWDSQLLSWLESNSDALAPTDPSKAVAFWFELPCGMNWFENEQPEKLFADFCLGIQHAGDLGLRSASTPGTSISYLIVGFISLLVRLSLQSTWIRCL